ncbi:MAG: transglutaminase domain-containing protein [Firmicutes bacterium]|nr:transglutaminase domain-containing protein [Bacillota bacterium]
MHIPDSSAKKVVRGRITYIVLIILLVALTRRICAFPKTLTVELGDRFYLDPVSDFLYWGERSDKIIVTDLKEIYDSGETGEYDVEIWYDDRFLANIIYSDIFQSIIHWDFAEKYIPENFFEDFAESGMLASVLHAKLIVQDTTPPKGRTVIDPVVWLGIPYRLEDFFVEIYDRQDVRTELVGLYDLTVPGNVDIKILLIDESNNFTEYEVNVELKEDKEAPVMANMSPIQWRVDWGVPDVVSDLDYWDNVSAKEDIKLTVDQSGVNYGAPGTYYIKYTLEDQLGNVADYYRTVNVASNVNLFYGPYDPELDAMINNILAGIITDNMSTWEKVTACFNWMAYNLSYRASKDYSFLSDTRYMAIPFGKRLLATGSGACYAYASVFGYMMNKIGVPVILVIGNGASAAGGYELHCWNMVNIGGRWLHCDTMYPQLYGYSINFCMVPSGSLYYFTHTWDARQYPWQ